MRRLILAVCLLSLTTSSPAAHAESELARPSDGARVPLRDRVLLGAYVPGLPYFEHGTKEFVSLEKRLGSKLPIASGFIDWDYVLGGPRDVALAAGGQRTLLYSWEPH